MMKLYDAVLHSGENTPEKIRSESDFPLSAEDVENIQKFNRAIEGIKAIVIPFGEEYHIAACSEIEKIKEACYIMEQDSLFGAYINQREEFEKDWESGNYDVSMAFSKDQVEIIAEAKS